MTKTDRHPCDTPENALLSKRAPRTDECVRAKGRKRFRYSRRPTLENGAAGGEKSHLLLPKSSSVSRPKLCPSSSNIGRVWQTARPPADLEAAAEKIILLIPPHTVPGAKKYALHLLVGQDTRRLYEAHDFAFLHNTLSMLGRMDLHPTDFFHTDPPPRMALKMIGEMSEKRLTFFV